jgi:hypothetical protein
MHLCPRQFLIFFTAHKVFNHHPDGFLIGNSENSLPLSFAIHQSGGFKFFNMMGYCGQGYVEIFRHATHGQAVVRIELFPAMPSPDMLEDGHAVFVG